MQLKVVKFESAFNSRNKVTLAESHESVIMYFLRRQTLKRQYFERVKSSATKYNTVPVVKVIKIILMIRKKRYNFLQNMCNNIFTSLHIHIFHLKESPAHLTVRVDVLDVR